MWHRKKTIVPEDHGQGFRPTTTTNTLGYYSISARSQKEKKRKRKN